ncbi:MAG: NAD(P)(+) transhydrogenase (Re/Si-specific) subunit alpha, partial [Bacteroidetes bacterium]|nr:NAD(P)(+) transhydrogenase (Re/Si-specific) subunit alpha [Bacteroidota bacterium]
MVIGLLKEPRPDNRVALLPEVIFQLVNQNVKIIVEKDAGVQAFSDDASYIGMGAEIVTANQIIDRADMLLGIHPPDKEKISQLRTGQVFIATFNPLSNPEIVMQFLDRKITSFSLDAIPRTTRAQAMDVLSSMATVSGYRAVLDAAFHLPTFFPMFMSAAGTIKPAKVLILGAGVAGLQAIATSRKLGAVVEAFDVRSAVKEEVKSLGAKFVEVEDAIDDKSAGGK